MKNYLFLLLCICALAACNTTNNFNAANVPLDNCIKGNQQIIPEPTETKKYCNCLVEKLTSKERLRKQFGEDLKKGNINKVIEIVQGNASFAYLNIDDCLKTVQMAWTKGIADGMVKNWKRDLKAKNFDKTYNLNLYCNCLLNEYKNYSLNKVLEPTFSKSRIGNAIAENCKLKAKL